MKTFGGSNDFYGHVIIDPHRVGTAWLFARDTAETDAFLYEISSYGSVITKHAEIYDDLRGGQTVFMPSLDESGLRIFHGREFDPGGHPRLVKSTIGVGMTDIILTHALSAFEQFPRRGRWTFSMA